MAKLTITNNTQNKYLVPSPIAKNLNRGETKSFTGISLNAVNQSKAFLTAMLHGSITVAVSEDPTVPNAIETTSASDVDAKIAAAIAVFKATLVQHPGPSGPFSTSFTSTGGTVTRYLGNLSSYVGYPVPGAQRLLTFDVVPLTGNTLATDTTFTLVKNGVDTSTVATVLAGSAAVARATLSPPLAFADGDKYDLHIVNTAGGGGSLSLNFVFGWSPTTV